MAEWYATGKEGKDREEQFEEQRALLASRRGAFWFRLRQGEAAKLTLLDTPDFRFRLHSFKIGERDFPFTCISDIGPCPMCIAGVSVSSVLVGTCLNHNAYTAKNGKEYKNQKQLLVLKSTAKKVIDKLTKRQKGDLRFAVLEVERDKDQKSLRTGEIFEFVKKLSEEKVKGFAPTDVDAAEWIKPLDYATEFAPLSEAEMMKIMGGGTIVPTKSVGVSADEDPFGPDDETETETEEEDSTPSKVADLI